MNVLAWGTKLTRLKSLNSFENDISQYVHKIQTPNSSVLRLFPNFVLELTSPSVVPSFGRLDTMFKIVIDLFYFISFIFPMFQFTIVFPMIDFIGSRDQKFSKSLS